METLCKSEMFNIIEFKCDLLIIKTLFLEYLSFAYKEKYIYMNCVVESDKDPVGRVGIWSYTFPTHIMQFHIAKNC